MRSVASWIMVLLLALAIPLSIVAVWAKTTMFDEDVFTSTLAPLASQPAVRAQLSESLTSAIEQQAAGLSIADVGGNAIDNVIETTVSTVIQSDQFAEIWDQMVREAHAPLVNLLEGDDQGVVQGDNATITLNLQPALAAAEKEIESKGGPSLGLDSLAPDKAQLTIFTSSNVATVHRASRLLDRVGLFLPLLVLVLFAGSILIADLRWSALRRAGGAIMIGSALLAIGLYGGTRLMLNRTPANVSEPFVRQISATLMHNLWTTTIAILASGALVWVAALLMDPMRRRPTPTLSIGSEIG